MSIRSIYIKLGVRGQSKISRKQELEIGYPPFPLRAS